VFKDIPSLPSPQSSEALLEQIWTKRLEPQIEQLFQVSPSEFKLNKNRSYSEIVRICQLGKSEQLANRITRKLDELISNSIDTLKDKITGAAEQSEDSMQIDSELKPYSLDELSHLKDFWMQFCKQMKSLSDVCLYLEKTYLISISNMRPLDEELIMPGVRNLSPVGCASFWQIGLRFLRHYLGKMDLKDQIVSGVLHLIENERDNPTLTNREIIAKLIHILLALKLYKGEFQEQFLAESKKYYM
jgi:hypothetical protein